MERNSWPYTAKEVKDIRLRHNMTQEYFAEVMGVTIDAVRKWEKKGGGIKTGPAIRMLQQIEAEGHIPTFLVMETHRA
jgi:DNA-binding transcriptional regulator YiaG